MEEHKCEYGCNQIATYQFDNGCWCCSDNMHRCPAERKRMSKRQSGLNVDSHLRKMERKVSKGNIKCKYCDKTANYYLGKSAGKDLFCCSETSRKCLEFGSFLGERFKQYYKDNPEHVEFQRQNVKEINNRKDVKEKKRLAMLNLHRGDCDECRDFQDNYHKAQKSRRDKNK